MPPLKFSEVLSFSSEDPNHPAENLLRPDTYRKWRCAAGTSDKQASVTLKFERLSSIHSLDIGNNGAAFVEVLVAREGVDFQVVLVASSFMTPGDSRNNTNLNRVRMFGSDKLNKNVAQQKWDRLKVVCTQPFNKNMQYGIAFITVTAPSEGSSDSTPKAIKLGSFTLKEEEDSDPISVGSVFARRKESEAASPLIGAAAIRAASASAASALTSSPNSEQKKAKPANAPNVGFYQLKKTTSSPSTDQTKTPSSSDGHKERDRNSEKSKDRDRNSDRNRNGDKERKRKDTDDRDRGKLKKESSSEKRDTPESNKRKKDSEEPKVKRTSSSEGKQKPSASSSASTSSSKKKVAPFSSLLKDVSFVLSGYQNPQRSQIRDMMLEMGARYKPDWEPSCTHLICAFANTPKYQQVKGKGKIVTAKWVSDCHKNKIRYPWRRYALPKQDVEESEEEIWAEELLPKEERPLSKSDSMKSGGADSPGYEEVENYSNDEDTDDEIQRVVEKQKNKDAKIDEKKKKSLPSNNMTDEPPSKKLKVEMEPSNSKKSSKPDVKTALNGTDDSIYDEDTDVDEENMEHVTRPDTSGLVLPSLGDYFKGKCFFIYGSMPEDIKHLLERYIVAFDGKLENYMTDQINFVVTEDDWDDNFDDALSENPSLQFVKPTWIWRCSDKQKLVPFQPFMVVPRD